MASNTSNLTLRDEFRPSDIKPLIAIIEATGVFTGPEIKVAEELMVDRVEKGSSSEYWFYVLECGTEVVGYVCYGPITMAPGRYDVYWIAISPAHYRKGYAGLLLEAAEKRIWQDGGKLIFVETSSLPSYDAARGFYLNSGYYEAARVGDFYADGNDKVIYAKYYNKDKKRRKKINWKIVLSNISEAREELQKLEELINSNKCDIVELQLSLQHTYLHVNFAWNVRRISTKQYSNLTQNDFENWSKYPPEINDYEDFY